MEERRVQERNFKAFLCNRELKSVEYMYSKIPLRHISGDSDNS